MIDTTTTDRILAAAETRGRPAGFEQLRTAFGRWLHEHGVSYAAAARALGTSRQHLAQICKGPDRLPSLDLAFRIEQYTNGTVTMQSWMRTVSP